MRVLCGSGVVEARKGGGALTLLLEALVLRLLQPCLRTDVVAAGLEEFGKDDCAADGACVGNILSVRAVEAALVAACGVDVGEEALVGVLVAEGPLPAHDYRCRRGLFGAAIVAHEGKLIWDASVVFTYTHAGRIE